MGSREEGQKQTVEGSSRPSSSSVCIPFTQPPLLFSLPEVVQRAPHSGWAALARHRAQDHSCSSQGTQGAVCLEASFSCPLEVGHMGKLVLLNGKAREILAKHYIYL